MISAGIFIPIMVIFIAITLGLGWYGHRNTKNNSEFLVGQNKSNPTLIALAYGATFLSASAIVGFGGMAAKYGLVMIWLVVLNIFIGLVIAFIVYGKRVRKINVDLKALSFADFLGKRFKSPAVRIISAIIVLVGMPIYGAAVVLGGVDIIWTTVGLDKNVVLLILSAVVILYVVFGGIIAVMYNDALQASIMFIGLVVILVFTFTSLDVVNIGIDGVFGRLSDIWPAISSNPSEPYFDAVGTMLGINGWTSFPEFMSNAWIYIVSSLLLGVGIGALAQPQLAVRFMSAKDGKSLNKSLIVGGIFMLVIVGSAYTVGALSNVFFFDKYGQSALGYVGDVDTIIPTFVDHLFSGMGVAGELFIVLFVLAITCACISTIGTLAHTMGSAAGYDMWSEIKEKFMKIKENKPSLRATRISTLLIMLVVVIIAYALPMSIIAKATSIFMGMTAAVILPAFTYSLFSNNPKKDAALWSMLVGAGTWTFWALLVNDGIGKVLFGITPIVSGQWIYVDPLIIALPVACITLIVVYLIQSRTRQEENEAEYT